MASGKIVLEGILGAVTIGTTILLSPLLRPWYTRWGMTAEEAQRRLPGDDRVSGAKSQITCALGIAAPPEKVWPWLV